MPKSSSASINCSSVDREAGDLYEQNPISGVPEFPIIGRGN
jgi:hypothetical protein